MDRGGRYLSFRSFFQTINVSIRFYTAWHISADDNSDNVFDANIWARETSEPQALNDLAVTLSTLEFLVAPKYDQNSQIILSTEASDPS